MIFQILDANYTYDPKGYPVVQLFGTTEQGRPVTCRVAGFRPYFYAGTREGRLEEAAEALRRMDLEIEVVERYEPIGYQAAPQKMLKITTKDPKEVRSLRDRVREVPGIEAVYETDILFRNRFLIDRGMGGMSWAQRSQPERAGEALGLDFVVPVQREANAPLRYLALDIECLPNNGEMPTPDLSPVILISLAFEPEYKGLKDLVLVGRRIECPRGDVWACDGEEDLLSRLISIIREFDPDVVAGYNSNEFDLPYLMARAERLKIEARVGRDGSPWHIKKIVTSNNVSITGRVVVDLLPLIRSSFSLKQYTLKNAASELLRMAKYDVNPKEIEAIWRAGGPELERFISYSRRDAVLALRLLLDLRFMDKYIALSRASGALLQDVVNGGQSGMVESLLLRRFRERDRVVPPKPDAEISEERYTENDELKGGAVLEPEKGLLENVLILDYKSLYPTIMMAHNLCYSTVVAGELPEGNEVIAAPSGGKFVSPSLSPGIVPGLLLELLDQRTETKRLMRQAGEEERRFLDAKQYAMKILLNSFYGYSGYARARLYSLALANAVTSFGRENILKTSDLINEIGSVYLADGEALFEEELAAEGRGARRFDLSVVYGDTDSVFVKLTPFPGGGTVALEDAELIGRKIAETATSRLPPPMELVFEAFARRALFLAKKRYALWVFERLGSEWKDRIKVRGMETVRRDWCGLTSKTLNRCLELVLKEGRVEDAVDHVRSVISRIQNLDLARDSEIIEDLTLTRRYTKSTASYKNKQPHIQLVEKMRRRGGHIPGVGDRVPFVIIRGRARRSRELFVDRAEDPRYAVENNLPLDTEYYVEKQILPPVLRIFHSFGISRFKLCQDLRQSDLLSFEPQGRAQRQKSLLDF